MSPGALKLAHVTSRLALTGIVTLLLLASGVEGQTITYTGDRGNSCTALPPVIGGSHVFTLSAAIPVGSFVVISAATTHNATLGSVSDSGSNTWVSDNSLWVSAVYRTFAISSVLTTGLAVGQTISINYLASDPLGETSCAVVSVFQNVISVGRVDQLASAEGTGTSWNVTLSSATTQANELLHTVFATTQSTGGWLISPLFQPLSTACSGSFCVFPGYRIVGATGVYPASAFSLLPVGWGGILTTYKDAVAPVSLQRLWIE